MIRNVVIHLVNEQPLLADIDHVPTPRDFVLVCSNLRTMNGKRPVFIDHIESTFVFPYGQVRFVEVPVAAKGGGRGRDAASDTAPAEGSPEGPSQAPEPPPEPEGDLEIDEDFLRRVREI